MPEDESRSLTPGAPTELAEPPRPNGDPEGRSVRVESSVRMEWYNGGPLPPPAILREYKQIVPDFDAHLLRAWDDERAFRHKVELAEQDASFGLVHAEIAVRKRGQTAGLVVVALFIGLAAYALHLGQPVAAATIAGLDLASLVFAFVHATRPEPDKSKPDPPKG